MAGFRKPKASQQAAAKIGVYGKSGTGKTVTMLLMTEGLARVTGKKTAIVDTEHGTDFYSQAVKERKFHPDAFDFDALYTRSITEVLHEIKQLDPKIYGQIGIDSITHLWEAAINAYEGKRTSDGGIPIQAWGKIKRPYKELFEYCMNSPMHFIVCGRQGISMYTDEETGETKVGGPKMKAEGETPYEPHILLRLETHMDPVTRVAVPSAFVEKDRTGTLAYKWIDWPNFDNCCKPFLHLLGGTQATMPSSEEASAQDAETLTEAENKKIAESEKLLHSFRARFDLADSAAEVEAISKEISSDLKKRMTTGAVADLRESYLEAAKRFKGAK